MRCVGDEFQDKIAIDSDVGELTDQHFVLPGGEVDIVGDGLALELDVAETRFRIITGGGLESEADGASQLPSSCANAASVILLQGRQLGASHMPIRPFLVSH